MMPLFSDIVQYVRFPVGERVSGLILLSVCLSDYCNFFVKLWRISSLKTCLLSICYVKVLPCMHWVDD